MHQHFNVVVRYKNATNSCVWNCTNLLHMVIVNLLRVSVTFYGSLEGGFFYEGYFTKTTKSMYSYDILSSVQCRLHV